MFKKLFGKSPNKQKNEVSNSSNSIKYRDFKNPNIEFQCDKEISALENKESIECFNKELPRQASEGSTQRVTNWLMPESSSSTLQEAFQFPPDYSTARPSRRLKKQKSLVPSVPHEQKDLYSEEEEITNTEVIQSPNALLVVAEPVVYTVPFTQKTSGKLEKVELNPSLETIGNSYAL